MKQIIWFNHDISAEAISAMGKNTMGEYLGIRFTEVGNNYLKATMPVNEHTRQPYGLLHGGASCVLAETIGSIASALVINPQENICVGLEINANHLRGVREGYVTGTATPLHLGSSTHVWDIRIHNDQQKLVCISRLTVAILQKKAAPPMPAAN